MPYLKNHSFTASSGIFYLDYPLYLAPRHEFAFLQIRPYLALQYIPTVQVMLATLIYIVFSLEEGLFQ